MTKPKTKAKGKLKKAGNLRSRFVDEYVIHHNATKAAEDAGYSKRSAGSIGHRLLKDAEILSEINKREAVLSSNSMIRAERVMQEYVGIALLDPLDLFTPEGDLRPIDQIPECARRAMAGIEFVELFDGKGEKRKSIGYLKKFKFADKKGALDSIAKILGMMRDKVDINLRVSAEEQEAAIDAELADLA